MCKIYTKHKIFLDNSWRGGIIVKNNKSETLKNTLWDCFQNRKR